jgi:hypothetical protein
MIVMTGPLPPPAWTGEEAREAADEILRDERYRTPAPSLIERVLEWIGDRLSDLFGDLFEGGAVDIVGWVLIAAALALIVWSITRLAGSVDVARRVADAQVMVELTRSPREWREQAATLEAQGRYKESLRCLYRALVADLVARDLIPGIPGRTAGEYARDVAARAPESAVAFAAATEMFELAWYAGAPTSAAECARFRALDTQVLRHPHATAEAAR